ncbi:MAG: hypothetical protein LAT55_01005 [Opitutales bacterium]|nr:hypothetical protein [Opitutales bacterium]
MLYRAGLSDGAAVFGVRQPAGAFREASLAGEPLGSITPQQAAAGESGKELDAVQSACGTEFQEQQTFPNQQILPFFCVNPSHLLRLFG